MKFSLQKGQLTTWKDDKGFGFIKPDDGGKEVFLHISALERTGCRPKVGDTILYEKITESDHKIRATRASIQGVALQPPSERKKKKGGLAETIIRLLVLITVAISAMELSRSRSPSSITSTNEPTPLSVAPILKPECVIKGNISIETDDKLYHLPGMEDYESTRINQSKGERWFCSESEATANGWRKAPR